MRVQVRLDRMEAAVSEFWGLFMSSPVIVALIGVIPAAATLWAKKPMENDKERGDRAKAREKKQLDRIAEVSEAMDKHINNSDIPLRKQINDKLDMVLTSVSSLNETTHSINIAIDGLSSRMESIEQRTRRLEENEGREHK